VEKSLRGVKCDHAIGQRPLMQKETEEEGWESSRSKKRIKRTAQVEDGPLTVRERIVEKYVERGRER